MLEDYILAHHDDAEFQKVPALGRHYSLQWAQEELMKEQEEASTRRIKKRKSGCSEVASMLRRCQRKT